MEVICEKIPRKFCFPPQKFILPSILPTAILSQSVGWLYFCQLSEEEAKNIPDFVFWLLLRLKGSSPYSFDFFGCCCCSVLLALLLPFRTTTSAAAALLALLHVLSPSPSGSALAQDLWLRRRQNETDCRR